MSSRQPIWCRKEGYISPLLLATGLFVHQVTRSRVHVDVLYALGFWLILRFLRLQIQQHFFQSQYLILDEEELREAFLQIIADNFGHNEDTTTGANTTHVMGIISAEFPKSQCSTSQLITRTKISAG